MHDGGHAWQGRHAWLGGMHGAGGGAMHGLGCEWDMCDSGWACMARACMEGVCMQERWPLNRMVRILLECILVLKYESARTLY